MAKLEGNPFTYPEIKTLLDGVTVGGHKLSDQEQVLRISNGWKKLIQLIKNEEFKLNKETAINLNVCIAEGEALAVGDFRDGNVLIGGTSYIPPKAEKLYALFQELIDRTNLKKSPDNAYEFFLQSAANQFFWDGNKRTG
ncbi:Fic family protein, partial [Thiolapillus sp.]